MAMEESKENDKDNENKLVNYVILAIISDDNR
ncbi:hypothetical protein EYZ11_007254 [Aspergillus tanneri]|uniref:Uncharacterized protein n=1 Tax=Aspergillus tanneri TaxID=1220188 RepID=A0A4S3JFR8_9EURO|nr:hypothetical protein EYZ11_007254 [Aspergillus tanneri]